MNIYLLSFLFGVINIVDYLCSYNFIRNLVASITGTRKFTDKTVHRYQF